MSDEVKTADTVVVAPPSAPVETPVVPEATAEPKVEPLPDYFIDVTEKHRINVHVLFTKKTGKLLKVVASVEGLDLAASEIGANTEWLEFTQPGYDDLAVYRQRCTVFNQSAGRMVVDATQLRHFLLIWHLKDWSIKDRTTGKKLELKHDKTGVLSDESMQSVYKTHPAILDAALLQLEKQLMLS